MKEDSEITGKTLYSEQPNMQNYKVTADEMLDDLAYFLDEMYSGTVSTDSGVEVKFTFTNGQTFLFNVTELKN